MGVGVVGTVERTSPGRSTDVKTREAMHKQPARSRLQKLGTAASPASPFALLWTDLHRAAHSLTTVDHDAHSQPDSRATIDFH
jgi:hypothetical protein